MSLINDALKQARKAAPRNVPSSLAPLQPGAREDASGMPGWLIGAGLVVLIAGAIFVIGWAVTNHRMETVAAPPAVDDSTQQEVAITLPVVKPRPVEDPPAPPPPPEAPKLQGIFYSPTAPSAILDGKTVHTGERFGDYKVKAITKYTVTLIGADKKEIQLGMEN